AEDVVADPRADVEERSRQKAPVLDDAQDAVLLGDEDASVGKEREVGRECQAAGNHLLPEAGRQLRLRPGGEALELALVVARRGPAHETEQDLAGAAPRAPDRDEDGPDGDEADQDATPRRARSTPPRTTAASPVITSARPPVAASCTAAKSRSGF